MQQCINDIRKIIEQARQKAYSATAFAMVEGFWLIGKRIVEEEQGGNARADYGKEVIKTLSAQLGKGFSPRTLWDYKRFYLAFPDWEDSAHACALLSWSHIRLLLRVEDRKARDYYIKEATEQNWAVRTLERNINTLYYHRLISSQRADLVEREMKENTSDLQKDKTAFIKNPTVLEFLGLPTNAAYTEQELEQGLIDNLQKFLLELGKGFAFVARQKHIRTETQDFFIDLVFYNYILKCFVILELKTNKMTHQDIGQLDMYVRMFDDLEKKENDNPTIGILLCTETDQTIAKYSVLSDNKQLFANKYMAYLPTEEELVAEIEREKRVLEEQMER
ncbi:PDDEXK nuclease domain-containing protein [Bergeyella zoohelcum]|uniref:PDDEXK nuclease domain-containing protein n=1 Tax=Bergeyella zoohelcum TaxID=1015 RepID=UPI002A911BBA|nr:PDDEXK nuclease domain-containing protein [Bergeyella zoohelcum]MDY6026186.1 PDDEXK nuclease domain-containing protein [Bergeyella zoohelcum]